MSADPTRRVAIVANASFYSGPPIARLLAARGHDLVLGDPAGGLVEELEALGATIAVVDKAFDLANPSSSERLVAAALERFGRLDAATMFSGQIVTGRFLQSSIDDLRAVLTGCVEAPYHFMQAVLPPMIDAGGGQVLILTSAAGGRPTPGAPLYSSARAAATMMVRNVAAEVARHQVQVNAIGTNFMDFPEFRRASGADDPVRRAKIEAQTPMGRLGTLDELAAFCVPYLDGTSRFATGQFTAFDGGWSSP